MYICHKIGWLFLGSNNADIANLFFCCFWFVSYRCFSTRKMNVWPKKKSRFLPAFFVYIILGSNFQRIIFFIKKLLPNRNNINKNCIFAVGKFYTTSSCQIPQDRKVARVDGWAVRYQAYLFLYLICSWNQHTLQSSIG